MKLINKKVVTGLTLSAVLLVSACGGSSGDSDSDGEVVDLGTAFSTDSDDFSFPVVLGAAQPTPSIEKPAGDAPVFSARRTLVTGAGAPIEFGDPVVVQYNMFSWATGELVESTDTLDGPLTISAGVTNGVPEYLSKSLLGRQVGDTLQVVFEQGMEDLPSYLDSNDAYVLIVRVL